MLSRLSYLAKSLAPSTKYAKFYLFSNVSKCSNQISHKFYSTPSDSTTEAEILDVDVDRMDEYENAFNAANETQSDNVITTTDLDGVILTPIDVDPWVDEEEQRSGTLEMELMDKLKEEVHYPEPPANRSGLYEFDGIKIWLPRKMLTPATYRYRLTDEEHQNLPDDIRICKFENFKPTS